MVNCCNVSQLVDDTMQVVSVNIMSVKFVKKKFSKSNTRTFGVIGIGVEFCKLLWLPWIGVEFSDVVPPVNDRPGTGGRRGGIELLFKLLARNSRFSRSSDACCNFNSLIADINSNFCVSKDDRESIS